MSEAAMGQSGDPAIRYQETRPMISDETRTRFDALVRRYPERRSALIPILHAVQAEVGYLSPEAIEWMNCRSPKCDRCSRE